MRPESVYFYKKVGMKLLLRVLFELQASASTSCVRGTFPFKTKVEHGCHMLKNSD